MSSNDSKIEKVQTHFQALTSVATSLNTASDELTKVVGVLDEALKKLNIGLTVWVNSIGVDVDPPEYDTEQIGYCKVNGKWGIALRRIWGDEMLDRHHEDGPWLFNDAPREMRLYGVDKIPGVIEALSKEASSTTKKIKEKTHEVRSLAAAITEITSEPHTPQPKKGVSVGTSGISAPEVKRILVGVQEQQKFLGELLEHASRWELIGSNDLRIYFSADKRPFAEMLEGRESISKISTIAKEVLGYPVQVVVKLEPPIIDVSKAGNDKGGK